MEKRTETIIQSLCIRVYIYIHLISIYTHIFFNIYIYTHLRIMDCTCAGLPVGAEGARAVRRAQAEWMRLGHVRALNIVYDYWYYSHDSHYCNTYYCYY